MKNNILPPVGIAAKGKGTVKLPLSASPNGTPILVTTSGVTIHEAPQGVLDEIYLWCGNYNASNASLQISFNDVAFTERRIYVTIQGQAGLNLVYPGVPHANSTIYAKASSNDSLFVGGYVLRSYPIDPGEKDYLSYGFDNG